MVVRNHLQPVHDVDPDPGADHDTAVHADVNIIKLVSFIADDEAKYARVFVPGNHFPV